MWISIYYSQQPRRRCSQHAKNWFLNAHLEHHVHTGQAGRGCCLFLFLLFTSSCPSPTLGGGLIRNAKAVQIHFFNTSILIYERHGPNTNSSPTASPYPSNCRGIWGCRRVRNGFITDQLLQWKDAKPSAVRGIRVTLCQGRDSHLFMWVCSDAQKFTFKYK